MDVSATRTIDVQQFLDWAAGRDERYELVNGQIVMMAGAGRRHDRIVVNMTALIHNQIKAGPCQTFTGDTFIAVSSTTRRMPDLGVDCGDPDDESIVADAPVLLVEVLSPTTGAFDVTVKLAEYQSLASVAYIVFVDTEMPSVHVYARDEIGRWTDQLVQDSDGVIELPKISVRLALSDIYADLDFRPRPRLVNE